MNNELKLDNITKNLTNAFSTLGLDLKNPNNIDTPKRVAKMWVNELCKNINYANKEELDKKMTLFDNPNPYTDELIIIKDIDFNSLCSHHFMPFLGKVTVAYVPNEKIIGLSKIPRVVKYFSQMPQLQESLTSDIGDYLFSILNPRFLLVHMEATHTCVMCRGAESTGSTDTFYTRVDNSSIFNKFDNPVLLNANIHKEQSLIAYYKNQYFNRVK